MLDLSPDKLLMLAVVALVVLGPNRLPGAARSVGRFLGQMRAMSSSFQTEVRQALHDPDDPLASTIADFRPSDVRRNVRRAVTETIAPFTPASAPGPTARPTSTNVSPTAGPTSVAGAGPEITATPTIGWDGHPIPDDPGFN